MVKLSSTVTAADFDIQQTLSNICIIKSQLSVHLMHVCLWSVFFG